MKRIMVVDISILNNAPDKVDTDKKIKLSGYDKEVGLNSLRIVLFKKHKTCVICGIVGSFLALECNNDETAHLNMYGLDLNGREILMTKDHILPKSKGGKDILENMQVMCVDCNVAKGGAVDRKMAVKQFAKIIWKHKYKKINVWKGLDWNWKVLRVMHS